MVPKQLQSAFLWSVGAVLGLMAITMLIKTLGGEPPEVKATL